MNAPATVEAGSFTQAVEFKLTTEAVRRIDPDRLGTTDEQLVHWAIGQAIMANAQDLHVMFERSSGVFRFSKDGVLQTLYSFSEQRWGTVVGYPARPEQDVRPVLPGDQLPLQRAVSTARRSISASRPRPSATSSGRRT